jgi:hypothetical protein
VLKKPIEHTWLMKVFHSGNQWQVVFELMNNRI